MRKFLKEGVVYGLNQALVAFVALLTAPFYTRFLSVEDYGLLDIHITVLTAMTILVELQMLSGYTRGFFEAQKTGNSKKLYGSLIVYYFAANTILAIGIFCFDQIQELDPEVYSINLLSSAALCVLPSQIYNLVLMKLRMERDIKKFLSLSIFKVTSVFGFGVTTVIFIESSPIAIVLSMLAANLISLAFASVLVRNVFQFSFSWELLKGMMLYSLPIVPGGVGSWILRYIDRFFIVSIIGLAAAGVYGLTVKVALAMQMIVIAFRDTWMPHKIKAFDRPGSESEFVSILNVFSFVGSAATAGLVVVSPFIFIVLGPSDYREGVAYLALLASAYFWEGIFIITSSGNAWKRKTYLNSIGTLIGVLIAIGLMYFFMPNYGLLAASLAALIGVLVKAYLVFLTSQRVHPMPYSPTTLPLLAGLNLLFCLSCYSLYQLLSGKVWLLTASFLIAGILFCISIFVFVLDNKSRSQLRALFKSITT